MYIFEEHSESHIGEHPRGLIRKHHGRHIGGHIGWHPRRYIWGHFGRQPGWHLRGHHGSSGGVLQTDKMACVFSLCPPNIGGHVCSRVSFQLWRTCFFSWCPPNIGGHVSSCGVLHTLEDMCLLVVSSKHWRTCVFSWCPPNIRGHVSAHGVTQSVNWRTQPIFKNWKILWKSEKPASFLQRWSFWNLRNWV